MFYTLLSTSTFQTYALFSVPILGGTPAELNPKLVEGGSICSFSVSLNSQRVIYSASQDKVNVPEIYSVLIGGGNDQLMWLLATASLFQIFGIAMAMQVRILIILLPRAALEMCIACPLKVEH